MRYCAIAAAVLCSALSVADAATVDLTDGAYTAITPSIIPGDPVAFTETSAGVTFTFTAIDNQIGTTRFVSGAGDSFPRGIVLGGGGGSVVSFSLTVSEAVDLTGYSGLNQEFVTAPLLSFGTVGGTLAPSLDFAATGFVAAEASLNAFPGGAIYALTPGTDYLWAVTNNSVTTQGYLTGLSFEVAAAPVPLPASLPMLLAGLGGVFALRRRRAA